MAIQKTSLERAFELAQSGKCLNLLDLSKKLKAEQLDKIYLEGKSLRKQLLQMIKSATHAEGHQKLSD